MAKVTTGSSNVAVGADSLSQLTTGSHNIALGGGAGINLSTETYNIDIGASGEFLDNGVIRIGSSPPHTAAFIAGISGVTSSGGTAVYIDSNGQLGTLTSSLRFKQDVEDMGDASAGLMRLRPVAFRYKPQYDDGSRLLQYGLVAEEVAKVYPELVQTDRSGKPMAVRTHFINAMMLNEVQRQHRTIAAQQERIDQQQAQIDELQRQVRELLRRKPAASD
jgi:hypothetical protein